MLNANYPVLTFCPASGQRVNSWRLMAPSRLQDKDTMYLFVHSDAEWRTKRKLEQQRHKNNQRSDDFHLNTLSRTTQIRLCVRENTESLQHFTVKVQERFYSHVLFFVNTVYYCYCSVAETDSSRTTNSFMLPTAAPVLYLRTEILHSTAPSCFHSNTECSWRIQQIKFVTLWRCDIRWKPARWTRTHWRNPRDEPASRETPTSRTWDVHARLQITSQNKMKPQQSYMNIGELVLIQAVL